MHQDHHRSSGLSSLDKSTMKQEFVDTSVGGTDDICSGCFFLYSVLVE